MNYLIRELKQDENKVLNSVVRFTRPFQVLCKLKKLT